MKSCQFQVKGSRLKRNMTGFSIISIFILLTLCLFSCQGNSPTDKPSIVQMTPENTQLLLASRTSTPNTLETINYYASSTSNFLFTQDPQKATIISEIDAKQLWIQGSPCFVPCWEGVTPGKSTKQDAVDIWKDNSLFRKVAIYNSEHYAGVGTIKFELNTISSVFRGNALFTTSEKIEYIDSIVLVNSYDISLDELIQSFGPPDDVIAAILPNYSDASEKEWILNIIWILKGFAFTQHNVGLYPQIDGHSRLPIITFFSPGVEGFRKTGLATDTKGDYYPLIPWHGFDKFEGYLNLAQTPTP
jgi:hypothetical protein